MSASQRAESNLARLVPATGPWTTFLLWWGLRPRDAPDTDLDDELDEVLQARLGPTLDLYARQTGLQLSESASRRLRADVFARQTAAHSAVVTALPALAELTAAGVRFAVMKGPGVAAKYPSPLTRPFSDLDLLVSRASFAQAQSMLEDQDWHQHDSSLAPWPFFDRWCREGVNLVNLVKNGNIDLHHRPSPWLWSNGIELHDVLARTEAVSWFGIELPCLSREDNLLVCSLQVISDHRAPGGKLLNWRDVAVLAQAVEPEPMAALAAKVGLTEFVLAILGGLPAGVVPSRLIEALSRGSRGRLPYARRLSAVSDRARASQRLIMQTHALRVPTATAAVYLLGSVLPSPAFIRQQTETDRASYPAWWRHALRRHRDVRTSA